MRIVSVCLAICWAWWGLGFATITGNTDRCKEAIQATWRAYGYVREATSFNRFVSPAINLLFMLRESYLACMQFSAQSKQQLQRVLLQYANISQLLGTIYHYAKTHKAETASNIATILRALQTGNHTTLQRYWDRLRALPIPKEPAASKVNYGLGNQILSFLMNFFMYSGLVPPSTPGDCLSVFSALLQEIAGVLANMWTLRDLPETVDKLLNLNMPLRSFIDKCPGTFQHIVDYVPRSWPDLESTLQNCREKSHAIAGAVHNIEIALKSSDWATSSAWLGLMIFHTFFRTINKDDFLTYKLVS